MASGHIRLSADVGGTFTDVAAFDETTGELQLGKTLTTPARLVDGIENGVAKAGADFRAAQLFLHGTTVAINTILERTGARLRAADHAGLPRHLRDRPRQPAGILQSVLPPARAADRARPALRDPRAHGCAGQGADHARRGPGARGGRRRGRAGRRRRSRSCSCTPIAIPAHEQRVKAIIEQSHPQLFVTASHELSQEYREFERTSTAAANAYVGPRVRRYLGEMGEHLEAAGFGGEFLIVQSTGGLFDVDEAQQRLHPHAGVGPGGRRHRHQGAVRQHRARRTRSPSTWAAPPPRPASSITASVLMTGSALIGGYATGLPVQIPMIDIQEVGTGGGSIARVEMGGALHVGPESAGARAGPGLLRPGRHRADHHRRQSHSRPAWRRPLSRRRDAARSRRRQARARDTRRQAARPRSRPQAADGILRIATTKMSHMVRWVTTERGLDAADFALVAYGGAGPLHAAHGRARACASPRS